MTSRKSIFSGRAIPLLILLLAVSLIGWNVLPKSAHSNTIESNQGSGIAAQQPVPAQTLPTGDAKRGQDLFMGRLHFKNDGPPCMGCHNVGSNGLLGGGVMGPDLTNVSIKRSPAEIASILSNSGPTLSPVMQPIFTEHPLTESEEADLIAFLNASVGQPESNKEILIFGISLGGLVGAILVLGFLYRNRLRGIRRALANKARAGK